MARPRKAANALQGAYTKEAMEERVAKEKAITGDSDNIPPPKFIENDYDTSFIQKHMHELEVI